MQIKCSICQRTIEVLPGEDPATVQCKFCKQVFKFKNQTAGQQKNAAGSGEKIITQCPHCQKQFRMYSASIGRDIKCLNCGKEFTVKQSELKEPNDNLQISQEHQADTVNKTIDEYSKRLDRRKNEWALISSLLMWILLTGLAVLALTADAVRRAHLARPKAGICINCGKPSARTVQYGNDESFGGFGPYIRKDSYDASEVKRLCYLCNKRMAVREQSYSVQSGHLNMDLCRLCNPPKVVTMKHYHTLEGPKIEISQWRDYPFCAKCIDFEFMTGDSLSTIPRKFILPVVLLCSGLFAGVWGLIYNLKIHSLGEFIRVFIDVWRPLE